MRTKNSNLFAGMAFAFAAAAGLAQSGPQASHGYVLTGNGSIVMDTRTAAPVAPPAGNVWWDNGNADGRNALQSQSLGSTFVSRVADDYVLSSGRWHMVTGFKVCMFVSLDVVTPVMSLDIFSDCNGKPGTVIKTLVDPTSQLLASGSPFPGFALYEFTFNTQSFDLADANGCSRIWLSPYGTGTGAYYWASSGDGHVQGVQGQFLAPSYGYPVWTDVADIVCCFTTCSDFCFKVIGDVCYTIKDQGNYDLAGLPSISFPNIDLDGARSADNFQVAAAEGTVNVCRVEGYLATNCDPKRVFAEIYSDTCNLPGGLLNRMVDPVFIPQNATYAGVPVFLFRFDLPAGVILQGGNNYWFSMAAQSSGSITDRAYFLFKHQDSTCTNLYMTEGVYRNPFFGLNVFTPISEATATGTPPVLGTPREFAFRIYGSQVPIIAHPATTVPGDLNGDGAVDTRDITLLLMNFGRQPQ